MGEYDPQEIHRRAMERRIERLEAERAYWRRQQRIWNWVWLALSLISVGIVAWALVWANTYGR